MLDDHTTFRHYSMNIESAPRLLLNAINYPFGIVTIAAVNAVREDYAVIIIEIYTFHTG